MLMCTIFASCGARASRKLSHCHDAVASLVWEEASPPWLEDKGNFRIPSGEHFGRASEKIELAFRPPPEKKLVLRDQKRPRFRKENGLALVSSQSKKPAARHC